MVRVGVIAFRLRLYPYTDTTVMCSRIQSRSARSRVQKKLFVHSFLTYPRGRLYMETNDNNRRSALYPQVFFNCAVVCTSPRVVYGIFFGDVALPGRVTVLRIRLSRRI